MKNKIGWIVFGAAAALAFAAQQSDVIIKLQTPERASIAVPDLRGSGEAQQYMNAFNETLWNDLANAGVFKMVSKSLYWTQVPRQPQDFRPQPQARPTSVPSNVRPNGGGLWLSDWSSPPVSAGYLAFGYTGADSGQIVLRGWLYNAGQADLANAQVIGKTYLAPLGEEGARKIAHEFAADILQQFGAVSLAESKIYYVSERQRGVKEIWSMDADGSNQKQLTFYKSVSMSPAVSPDNTRLAFSSFARGNPAIMIHSLETGRRLPFYNEISPLTATPEFTPDGKQILFASSVTGWAQIYIANLDGSGMRRVTYSRSIDMEPKVNPKTGTEIAFISDRSGLPQIYRMSMEGTDVTRLTTGEGEAVNPAWHPNGQHIAFSWTRGYAPGNYNIFIMDVATRQFVQLTHGAGRNEHPSWAPDGRHIVFSSNRSGSLQIWSMLMDGTQLKQLTTQGRNTAPAWSRK
ncbi:MAG: translocation protein TolB [Acidobacteriota bacterium]